MHGESIKLILNVEKSKFRAFLEMLKLFEFVSVEPLGVSSKNGMAGYAADSPTDLEKLDVTRLLPKEDNAEKRALTSIQRGAAEVKLHLEGKKQLKTLQSLIDEL